MKINLLECDNQPKDLEIGDIIIFQCENEYDYYLLIHNCNSNNQYQMLRLPDCIISKSFKNKEEFKKHIRISANGWYLSEIVKSDKLELKRCIR